MSLLFSTATGPRKLYHRPMARTREKILRERRRLKEQYGALFDSVAALLFRHDPIGIAFENSNTDEYEPETGTILPRLRRCESHADALRAVHEEFVRWFDADTVGPGRAVFGNRFRDLADVADAST